MFTSSASASGRENKQSSLRRRLRDSNAEEREKLLGNSLLQENIPPAHDKEDSSDDERYTDAVETYSPLQSPAHSARLRASSGPRFSKGSISISCDNLAKETHAFEAPSSLPTTQSQASAYLPKSSAQVTTVSIQLPETESATEQTATPASSRQDRVETVSCATQTDNYKTVSCATQTDNYETPDGTEFCRGCNNARFQADHEKKAYALLDRIHCSACEMEHGALYFSAYQRHQKSDADRVCIGHEGHIKLCPHRSITLETLEEMKRSWQTSSGNETWDCNEPSCATFGNLNIRYSFTYRCHYFYLEWAVKISTDRETDVHQAAVDRVAQLLQNSPQLFCPHVQAAPGRFKDIPSIRPTSDAPFNDGQEIKCYCCMQKVSFHWPAAAGDHTSILVKGFRPFDVTTRRDMRGWGWQWALQIDPQSFNMKRDFASKHIFWCDGGNDCATNYSRLRYTALLREAQCPGSSLRALTRLGRESVVKSIDHTVAIKERYYG